MLQKSHLLFQSAAGGHFQEFTPPVGTNMSAPNLPNSMSERANAVKIGVLEISQMLHLKKMLWGAAPCSLRRVLAAARALFSLFERVGKKGPK